MRVTDLTPDHVGRRVSVVGTDWQVVGHLWAVETQYDYVVEGELQALNPEPILTYKSVIINVSGWERDVSESWDVKVVLLG